MTETRFIRKGYKIWDTWKDEEVYEMAYFYEVDIMCDIMNEIVDENEQLKSEYEVLHTQYRDMKKFVENNFDEYLTQEKLNRQIIKLSDENEELKQTIKCICKDYENYHGMDIRNAEWFTVW